MAKVSKQMMDNLNLPPPSPPPVVYTLSKLQSSAGITVALTSYLKIGIYIYIYI